MNSLSLVGFMAAPSRPSPRDEAGNKDRDVQQKERRGTVTQGIVDADAGAKQTDAKRR